MSTLYTTVLRELGRLPPGQGDDLMQRWRQFNVQSLMLAPQAERDQAGAELQQILREARQRQKSSKP